MGLDISHDAFHGSYSSFNRFRQAVAESIGGSFPPTKPEFIERMKAQGYDTFPPLWWYWGDGYSQETHPGLYAFFMHSDCDGEIDPATAGKLADEMRALLPVLDELGKGSGHIEGAGGYGAVARQFIRGCDSACARGDYLLFR